MYGYLHLCMYLLLIWQHASFPGESSQPMINQLNHNCEIAEIVLKKDCDRAGSQKNHSEIDRHKYVSKL